MTTVTMSRGTFPLYLLVMVAGVAFFEYAGLTAGRGALLMTLVFWTTLLQGTIAVAAVADLVGARWITGLRRELLAAYPLLLVPPVLLILLIPRLELYPWAEAPGQWLNEPFFLLRNLALLLAVYGTGRVYARRSLRGDPQISQSAVIYLFAFVASQTLVAFDWVMSLEYPWVNTLLGAYFFVEALYAGLALAGILCFLLPLRRRESRATTETSSRWDIGLLLFGFSVLWGGLFFAQYLLLWYGNLPEEVHFIARRLESFPLLALGVIFLFANFFVPFLVLLGQRAKRSAFVVGTVATMVLLGLFAERLFFILPVVTMSVGILAAENILLLVFWLLTVHSREQLLPAAPESAGE
jgi:hypothetical protein